MIQVNLEEVQRMLKVVEDLLLLGKLDYQPEAFKFERLDFVEFMREVYEQARKMAEPKNIDVKLVMSDKPLFIMATKLHLRRLFINLISNAVKFTPEKGRVDIVVKQVYKRVAISVADTGMGIRNEDIPKIFDRFFHMDRREKDVESGSGLGLSIAQSIVKIHRGDIRVESFSGAGSTFTVRLPMPD
jgi:two-component system phosphate regulon sensor histidine kinase PhoR